MMLLDGFNHVAILTNDTERLHAFYAEVFDATVAGRRRRGRARVRMSVIHIGPHSELNVFEIDGNSEADRQTPMFGRGRIDHLGGAGRSRSRRSRPSATGSWPAGAADDFVTDFGPILSLFFTDPDGLECEVCVDNPDAVPGCLHPPGTPAARYQS